MKPFVIAAALLAAGPALAAESPLKICTNPDANLEAALRACGQVIDDRREREVLDPSPSRNGAADRSLWHGL